jgi:hypothetical protein
MSIWYLDIIPVLRAVVSYSFIIGINLAAAMSGFVAVLLMSGRASIKSTLRAVIVASIVVGILSIFILWNPVPPRSHGSSFLFSLGTWLYYVLEFITMMVLSLAGGALGFTFFKRPERMIVGRRSASLVAGAIAAVVFAIVYISLNTATGNTRMAHNAIDFIYPAIFNQVVFLLAALIAGVVAVRLTRQSMSSPFNLVVYTAMAGVLAGLSLGLFLSVYDSLVLGLNYFYTFGWDSLPYYLFKVMWATLRFTLLAIGSGIVYARLAGEPKPGPSGPATMAAAM